MERKLICEYDYVNNFFRELREDLEKSLIETKNNSLYPEDHNQIVEKELFYLKKLEVFDRARWHTMPNITSDLYPIYEVPIVDHCNYNCAYCNHWANIAPKHFYDYDEYCRDIKRLSELCNGEFGVKLMGGEPSIHPRLKDMIKESYKYVEQIQILTNGLTLIRDVRNKDYSMLDFFEKYNVKLEITRYPQLDYTELYKVLKNYDVVVDYEAELGNPEAERNTMQIHGVDLNGNSKEWKNRHLCCGNSNVTPVMKNGKIYSCPFKACLNIFIEHFGLEDKIQITKADYIDIYEAASKEEIGLFLTKGTPACRYCTGDTIFNYIKEHPWRKTTKSITEWIDNEAIQDSRNTEQFDIVKNY